MMASPAKERTFLSEYEKDSLKISFVEFSSNKHKIYVLKILN